MYGRKDHECNYYPSYSCKPYPCYIRIKRTTWKRIGTYHAGCKSFTPTKEEPQPADSMSTKELVDSVKQILKNS